MTRIKDIGARCEAATPGPWGYDGMHNEIYGQDCCDFLVISELRTHPREKIPDTFGHTHNPDFDFIAHAREDIPWLLEQLAARDARIADLEREKSQGCECCEYRTHSQHISRQPHCNTCALQKICCIRPGIGEWGRINCALWRGPEETHE